MTLVLLAILAGLLAVLLLITALGSARINRLYPHQGKAVECSGGTINLVEWGKPDSHRPSLLFIHGASSSHREFMIALGDLLRGRLADDQHIIFVDRPGHGWSSRARGDHSPRVQADRIMQGAEICGTARLVVVGHSWGGSVLAQIAVHHHERIAGALFVAPATHPWKGGGWGGVDWFYGVANLPLLGWLFTRIITLPAGWFQIEQSVANVFAPEAPTPGYARALGAKLVLRPFSFRANAQDVFRLRPFVEAQAASYASIACPTAIVTGDADGVVWPHVHSDGLERDIPGARKIVIKGAGHMPHHTHAALMLDLIKGLLEPDGSTTNNLQDQASRSP